MTNDQPRQPQGSPDGGQFGSTSGGESELNLMAQVGARVDNELRSILEDVMRERHLGDPANPSDEETLRAAEDYMGLEDFGSLAMQARHAIEDVANAAELDHGQVRSESYDAKARLDAGEMVRATAHIGGKHFEGEMFRSSTEGKVWFLAEDAYPSPYRGEETINTRVMGLARHAYVNALNLDVDDDDNDYDLIYELSGLNEDRAKKAWDYMQCSNTPDLTVDQAIKNASRATAQRVEGLLTAEEHVAAVRHGMWVTNGEGRRVHTFGHSGRPDHVWVIEDND